MATQSLPAALDTQHQSHLPGLSEKLPKLTPRKKVDSKAALQTSQLPTPPLESPPPRSSITPRCPTRRILSLRDHQLFLSSPTHTLVVSFIFSISDSVKDVSISSIASQPLHETVTGIAKILSLAIDQVDACPPEDTGSRFGNPVFRTYITSLGSMIDGWQTTHLALPPDSPDVLLSELRTYFLSSLGSPERIDYGSGHELHFFIYLLVLNRLGLLPPSTFPSLALVLLPSYLRLMRTLQSTYYLEPAGSHGVWGLDDYHFLPFLFGASQLSTHPFIRPLAIHNEAIIDAYADDFLYLDMVRAINASKTVSGLRWHSPMLDDISGVKLGWGKVEAGMRKMFLREVIGKLVVMQHFLFGGVVPAVPGMSHDRLADASTAGAQALKPMFHAHDGKGWDDCCGIAVPSGIGAIQEMRKQSGEERFRRIPFD